MLPFMESGSPYSPPKETCKPSAAEVVSKMKFWKKVIWVAVVLFASPMALVLLSVINVIKEGTHSLGGRGIGDPTALAAVIGESIIAIVAGLVFSLPGIILFIIALIKFRTNRTEYRALTA